MLKHLLLLAACFTFWTSNSWAVATPIDELEAVQVNGTKQWLLYRGEDRNKPVILFVHGGPGSPLMLFSRAFDTPFIKEFVVVHWDQRGAGKSYDPTTPAKTYNLNQIADDGLKITRHIRHKFGGRKVILVGHSWGTIVSFRMVTQAPEEFVSYVSVGTVADYAKADELKYEFLKKKTAGTSAPETASALRELGPPPYKDFKQLATLSQLLWKYGGSFKKLTMEDLNRAVQKTTDYSESELELQGAAMEKTFPFYSEYLNHYKATAITRLIRIPAVFVHGRYDMATPVNLTRTYFNEMKAPAGKKWVEFENSAHFPMYEEPAKFLEVLRKIGL